MHGPNWPGSKIFPSFWVPQKEAKKCFLIFVSGGSFYGGRRGALLLSSSKEGSKKRLFAFCFWWDFFRHPAAGLTSFITERSKQERCHRFDAVDRAKEKQSPFENRLFGDVSRGTAALTLRPLPALRLMAQTRDMIARAGKPPGPRTAENNQVQLPPASTRPTLRAGGAGLTAAAKWK